MANNNTNIKNEDLKIFFTITGLLLCPPIGLLLLWILLPHWTIRSKVLITLVSVAQMIMIMLFSLGYAFHSFKKGQLFFENRVCMTSCNGDKACENNCIGKSQLDYRSGKDMMYRSGEMMKEKKMMKSPENKPYDSEADELIELPATETK